MLAKVAKVVAKGISPISAMPAAALIMFCSAMPKLKNRSGKAFLKSPVLLERIKSAVSTTTLGLLSPSSTSALP